MAAPLKDGLGVPAIRRLAENLSHAWPEFDTVGFVDAARQGLSDLELKERVAQTADHLVDFLPGDYARALEIIVASTEIWDVGDRDDPLRGFAAWPLFHFIEHRGHHDFDRSMAALRRITHLFSGEFAIRPFVELYPDRAFRELREWTQDESEHVRRLASEGIRPRLPWASRLSDLIADPGPVLGVLEMLKDDASLYVRRSVANNLNDISKDHPDRVIDVCEAWLENASTERRWIIERATRTLVKAGHPRIWGLLGFTRRPRIAVSALRLSAKKLHLGDELEFRFQIESESSKPQRLAVDYVVHFVKASGKTRPKVFKLKVLELEAKEIVELSGRRSFRAISTRSYHPGRHRIEVVVNGVVRQGADFALHS